MHVDDIDVNIPIMQDKKNDGVSRFHAEIIVESLNEEQVVNPNHTTGIQLKDLSKFGTCVNFVKIQGSVSLKKDDIITFGANTCQFKVKFQPIVFLVSKLNKQEKDSILAKLCQIDARITEDMDSFTHLVCKNDNSPPTEKVAIAMLKCRPIVTTDFVQAIMNRTHPSVFPRESDFPPTLDLSEWPGANVQIIESRRTILKNKEFVFVTKESMNKYKKIIEIGGGSIHFENNFANASKWDKSIIVCPPEDKSGLESIGFDPIKERDVFGLIATANESLYCNPKPRRVDQETKKSEPERKVEREAMQEVFESPAKKIKTENKVETLDMLILTDFVEKRREIGSKSFKKKVIPQHQVIQQFEEVTSK